MSSADMYYTLQQLKKELWKGIPMSKESEKKYKQFTTMCKGTRTTYIPRGGSKWDEQLGLGGGGMSLKNMRSELERCAEKDRKDGGRCGLACQIRKRRSGGSY